MALASNKPFREAAVALVESGRYTWVELAWRCGMKDSQALKQALGVSEEVSRLDGHRYMRERIGDSVASRLMDGLELDPVEVGI